MFFSSGEIHIKLDKVIKSTLFLYPSILPSENDESSLLTGNILLILPKSKGIESLKIKLEGKSRYNSGSGSIHEEEIWLNQEVAWDGKGEVLEAGKYTYPFSFRVPSDSPEYQRSQYGRSTLNLSASAITSGTFKNTISSRLVPIFVLANPANRGELPDTFNELLTGWTEDVGPIKINISSPHLSVSSLVLFDISLPSSPSNLILKSVRGFITQTFEIHYKNNKILYPPKEIHTLFNTFTPLPGTTSPSVSRSKSSSPKTSSLDLPSTSSTSSSSASSSTSFTTSTNAPTSTRISSNLPPLIEGEEWEYSKLIRVPHDDIIRATTVEGSKSRVRVSHEIGVEIVYCLMSEDEKEGNRKAKRVEKKVVLKKGVHIISCCWLRSDLFLPKYQPKSSHSSNLSPLPTTSSSNLDSQCACTFTFKELLDQEEEIDAGFTAAINLGGRINSDRDRNESRGEGCENSGGIGGECKSAAIGGGRDALMGGGRENFSSSLMES